MSFSQLKQIRQEIAKMDPADKLAANLPGSVPHQTVLSMLSAFASAFTQNTRFIQLQIGDGAEYAEELLPQSVLGREKLSGQSVFIVTTLSYNSRIPTEELEGLPAQIKIATNPPGLSGLDSPGEIIRCGLITKIDTLPSDGGFAKYQLTIKSPLALLKHRKTSRLFQDMTVEEIVKQILTEHSTNNPAIGSVLEIRFVLRKKYKPRSYLNQYRESDLRFLNRILREEGISYRWEHLPGDTPRCRLVFFDDPYDIPQATQGAVRFHRAAATESEDSLTEWNESRRIGPSSTSLRFWDYKPASTKESHADGEPLILGPQHEKDKNIPAESTLEDYDAPTTYYNRGDTDTDRYATLRQKAHDRRKIRINAAGNVRQLIAGEWFRLEDHPSYPYHPVQEREFAVCALEFDARNNLPKGLSDYLNPKETEQSPPPYRVRLRLRKRGLPLTPRYAHTKHARPTASGPRVAVVVGPAGEEVYTDNYGRIKLQFPSQRNKEHPDFGAAFNERSSCWVRVVYAAAGAGWGCQQIPRIGQEVVVIFLDNDIDRPLVIGVIHNGMQPPNWFSGAPSLPANRTLSGIKTKEFHNNNYNELIFDDTQGEIRTRLSTEHGKTQFNQGFLIHPRKEGKGDPRGEGFELRTDRSGALRAAEGLLLSAYGRKDAFGKQLDRAETVALLELALGIAKDLSQSAQAHHADDTDTEEQERLLRDVKQWEDGSNTAREAPVKSNKAILTATAPNGIALAADANLTLAAGTSIDQIAAQDSNTTVGRNLRTRVGAELSTFTRQGMKFIAAEGNIQTQAHNGEIELGAVKKLHIWSLEEVIIEAPKVTIRGENGSVEYAQGILSRTTANHTLHAANLSMPGPASVTMPLPGVPASQSKTNEIFVLVKRSGEAVESAQYELRDGKGTVENMGGTDNSGSTTEVRGNAIAPVVMKLVPPDTPESPPEEEENDPADCEYFYSIEQEGETTDFSYRIDAGDEKLYEGELEEGETLAFPLSEEVKFTYWTPNS